MVVSLQLEMSKFLCLQKNRPVTELSLNGCKINFLFINHFRLFYLYYDFTKVKTVNSTVYYNFDAAYNNTFA